MKDICLLNDSFPPIIDGVSNAVFNYGKVLSRKGVGVSVVTPDHPEADDANLGFPVIRYPGMDMSNKIGYVVGNPFYADTMKIIKTMDVGLLHSHCPMMSNILAMELRSALDVPMIMTYHTKFDIEIRKAIKSKVVSQLAIKVLIESVSSCDELWVVSRGAGESLKSLGYKGDYIVMDNGVDMKKHTAEADLIRKVTASYDLPQGVPVFLFVGRLMWYKGLRIILDALAALRSNDVDFRMVFVGKGQEEEEVRSYCSSLGLDGKCFFTGPVYDREELAAWYSRADLFLFPSTFDTNGLVVREAAACSLGSVLVRDSCASEGVTNGVDGLLIDETPASLATCLMRAIDHPEVMHRVGQNASENLYLSWDDSVSRALKRYEIVMDNYRCGRYPKHKRPMEGFLAFYAKMMGL
jgi:glycosyltransferase involved in cell wall biosynthesis